MGNRVLILSLKEIENIQYIINVIRHEIDISDEIESVRDFIEERLAALEEILTDAQNVEGP